MQYRKDIRSGNQLSCLGFGCMRFPTSLGGIDKAKTEALILRAVEAGVNYFDTAYAYGGSEEILGELLEKNHLREKVYIATKLPQMMCKTSEAFDRIFNEELARLRTDHIDYYLLHNISDFLQWERLTQLGIREWIAAKKEAGDVRRMGFSFHGTYPDFVKMLDAYDWDFVQIQYNYINEHYQAGVEGLCCAASRGIPVIIMEPLMGGRLASVPPAAEKVFQAALPGSTPVGWALNWLWNQQEVTVLLSGMNKMEQLEENLKLADNAVAGMFSERDCETVKQVTEIVSKAYKIPCTGCNYCLPCAKGINIPSCFAAYNASYAESYMTGVAQYMNSIGIIQQSDRHYASDCIGCGACEKKCPQHIEIRSELKRVKRRLQVPGSKVIPLIASRFAK